jgi:hypothetical protein
LAKIKDSYLMHRCLIFAVPLMLIVADDMTKTLITLPSVYYQTFSNIRCFGIPLIIIFLLFFILQRKINGKYSRAF